MYSKVYVLQNLLPIEACERKVYSKDRTLAGRIRVVHNPF